jgi:hypothetical protein
MGIRHESTRLSFEKLLHLLPFTTISRLFLRKIYFQNNKNYLKRILEISAVRQAQDAFSGSFNIQLDY